MGLTFRREMTLQEIGSSTEYKVSLNLGEGFSSFFACLFVFDGCFHFSRTKDGLLIICDGQEPPQLREQARDEGVLDSLFLK